MMQTLTPVRPLAHCDSDVIHINDTVREKVRSAILGFLDTAATATGRETFYNTREEQLEAERAIHDEVFLVNRGLYAAMLTLPGVNDRAIQEGLQRLLGKPHPGEDWSMLGIEAETRLIDFLAKALPPQRLFKLFVAFQTARINNRRTRRLILTSILGSDKLAFWAVKYRTKLRAALRHALGSGVANGIVARVKKPTRTPDDDAWLRGKLDRHLPEDADRQEAYECVCFILGGKPAHGYIVPMLKSFHEARTNLEHGAKLPVEVLGGIRSRYHKETPHARVLELARDNNSMTDGQKMAMQKSASRQKVELEFDPTRADMIRLYVYALECGMTDAIRSALDAKAKEFARRLPVRYEKVGILVDRSASMEGTSQGKYRPLAIALSLRDILVAAAGKATVEVSSGVLDPHGLVRPLGETNLAQALVQLMQNDFDAVYLLTDGYENAPAGRVDEVLRALRKLGVETPIFQVTPTLAGETAGVRRISDEVAPLPVSRPEAMGLALVRAALTNDVETGIRGLLNLSRPLLENV